MVAPEKYVHVLVPRNCDNYLIWEKIRLRTLGLSRIIKVGPKWQPICPHMREAGELLREKNQ